MLGPPQKGPWHTWFAWHPAKTDWHGWKWLTKLERQYWRADGCAAKGWNYQPVQRDSPTYSDLLGENMRLRLALKEARGELPF